MSIQPIDSYKNTNENIFQKYRFHNENSKINTIMSTELMYQ